MLWRGDRLRCGTALELDVLDVFVTPIQMKKNRPAVQLTILCPGHLIRRVEQVLFRETTTLASAFGRRSPHFGPATSRRANTLWPGPGQGQLFAGRRSPFFAGV